MLSGLHFGPDFFLCALRAFVFQKTQDQHEDTKDTKKLPPDRETRMFVRKRLTRRARLRAETHKAGTTACRHEGSTKSAKKESFFVSLRDFSVSLRVRSFLSWIYFWASYSSVTLSHRRQADCDLLSFDPHSSVPRSHSFPRSNPNMILTLL